MSDFSVTCDAVDTLGPMTKTSDAYEEAVRRRAIGVGLVPIGLINRLTPEEWGFIRLMSQSEARRLVAAFDEETPSVPRTNTPRMDPMVIDQLLKGVGHGN